MIAKRKAQFYFRRLIVVLLLLTGAYFDQFRYMYIDNIQRLGILAVYLVFCFIGAYFVSKNRHNFPRKTLITVSLSIIYLLVSLYIFYQTALSNLTLGEMLQDIGQYLIFLIPIYIGWFVFLVLIWPFAESNQ